MSDRLDPVGDGDLAERVKAGDAAAFDALVRRHLRPAFAVAYRILGQREDAEDVVQEAFLAALQNIRGFDSARPFAPWLYRIVANRAINARKARALRTAEPIPAQAASADDTPETALRRNEEREILRRALEGLPERARIIVRLFELEGFTAAEIGRMLGMPGGTVRWHLHRSRILLRAALAPEPKEVR